MEAFYGGKEFNEKYTSVRLGLRERFLRSSSLISALELDIRTGVLESFLDLEEKSKKNYRNISLDTVTTATVPIVPFFVFVFLLLRWFLHV